MDKKIENIRNQCIYIKGISILCADEIYEGYPEPTILNLMKEENNKRKKEKDKSIQVQVQEDFSLNS